MKVSRAAPSEQAQVLETHISTVVFVGERALKFMKPIATPFLDQSTVERRQLACEQELRLNRRIASDVYLGVGHVVEDGEVTDHFLVMRRLPLDRRLSALVDSARFSDHIRAVARVVAAFHERQPATSVAAEMASCEGVRGLWSSNLEELRDSGHPGLATADIEAVTAGARRYLDGREALFADRIARGFARDGHGDLLADDIFMLDDGPRVLDCLAFDERLRCGDVLLDVAFLAMDVERLGAAAMAARLLEWYSEFTNEHHPRSLTDFYIAYRALVRAKVNVMRARQGDEGAADLARGFMRQCRDHLRASLPAVVVIGGAPGTGKTTLANDLADRVGLAVLSSDEVRKDLAGMSRFEHAYAAPGKGIYSPTVTARTYTELIRRAATILAMGESVVLDASWTKAEDRAAVRHMADAAGALVVELRCEVDPVVAAQRIAARMTAASTSDATPEVAAHMRDLVEPWQESTPIDTSRDRDTMLAAAVDSYENARTHID